MATIDSNIKHLEAAFPVPRPKPTNVRHQHYSRTLEKYGLHKCGVYHFARWVAQGQAGVRDLVLS